MIELTKQILLRTSVGGDEINWLRQRTREITLERGESFCVIGQNVHEVGFVETGLLQVYQVTEQGEHIVLDFAFPGMFVLALEAAIRGKPSAVVIEAVKPCSLRAWPYALRVEAQTRDAGWALLETQLLQEAFVRKMQRHHSIMTMDARQRFERLNDDFPLGWQQIPQHLLASYLHVTPPYYSRLKRTLKRMTGG